MDPNSQFLTHQPPSGFFIDLKNECIKKFNMGQICMICEKVGRLFATHSITSSILCIYDN